MVLLCDMHSINKYSKNEAISLTIIDPQYSKFNKLKKVDLIGFYYWCKALELYNKITAKSVNLSGGIEIPL